MAIKHFDHFFKSESSASILLGIAAIIGLLLNNTPAAGLYQQLLYSPISVFNFSITPSDMINEGLMVLFFFIIGLEIKREVLVGELNSIRKILLPAIAAFAGMLFPALIYLLSNHKHSDLLRGWAIPTATDIAFALGVLTLLGKRIPLALKIFLTALAIFDDLGAIIIIAIFYTDSFSMIYLGLATVSFLVLCILNFLKIRYISFYVIIGILLWFCIIHAGIHGSIAGVLVALTIPLDKNISEKKSLLRKIEKTLHPWVAFLILPLFAFANMGVRFSDLSLSNLFSSVPIGIFLGLVIGKQFGVFFAVWAAVKSGVAKLPKGTNWAMIYGTALLCGIGFTMSLFIGDLAFDNEKINELIRSGVLLGSLVSGFAGYIILRFFAKK